MPQFEDADFQKMEPLPAGWYPVKVIDSEIRPDTKGRPYVKVEIEVLSKNAQGRHVWTNFSQYWGSYNRQLIGQFMEATGMMLNGTVLEQFRESKDKDNPYSWSWEAFISNLKDRMFSAKLKIVPPKDGYDAKNEVSGFKQYIGKDGLPATQPDFKAPEQTNAPPSIEDEPDMMLPEDDEYVE